MNSISLGKLDQQDDSKGTLAVRHHILNTSQCSRALHSKTDLATVQVIRLNFLDSGVRSGSGKFTGITGRFELVCTLYALPDPDSSEQPVAFAKRRKLHDCYVSEAKANSCCRVAYRCPLCTTYVAGIADPQVAEQERILKRSLTPHLNPRRLFLEPRDFLSPQSDLLDPSIL